MKLLQKLKRLAALSAAGEVRAIGYPLWIRLHRLDFSRESVEDLGISPEFSNEHADSGGPAKYGLSATRSGSDSTGWTSRESVEDLGISPEFSNEHADSGGPALEQVLKRIKIQPGSTILDYGAGKGGACITMAKFPFVRVIGVELCESLVTVARENVAKLGLAPRIEINCADAIKFYTLDHVTHAYFFNPFAPSVVQKVSDNLLASIDRNPRTITLICKYPERHFERCFQLNERLRLLQTIRPKFSHPFYILEMS